MNGRDRTKAQAIKLLSRASRDLDDAVKMLRQEGFAPETVLASTALRNTASAISRLSDPPTTEMTEGEIRTTVTFNEVQAKGREAELRIHGLAPPLPVVEEPERRAERLADRAKGYTAEAILREKS